MKSDIAIPHKTLSLRTFEESVAILSFSLHFSSSFPPPPIACPVKPCFTGVIPTKVGIHPFLFLSKNSQLATRNLHFVKTFPQKEGFLKLM
jgi:hypothetical protein